MTPRDQKKISDHLATCAKCAIVSEEVNEVGSHLAMVLLPIMLGAGVGGLLLASLSHTTAAAATTAAAMSALPAVPAAFAVVMPPAIFAPAVGAGLAMGAATGVGALLSSAAVVVAIGGGIALGLGGSGPAPNTSGGSAASSTSAAAPSSTATNLGAASGSGTDSRVGATVGSLTAGLGHSVVDPLLGVLTPGASSTGLTAPGGAPVTTVIRLGGAGTPAAEILAEADGVAYGKATVASNGTWSIQINALPATVTTLYLRQTLTVLGSSLPIHVPLTLETDSTGIVVTLLN